MVLTRNLFLVVLAVVLFSIALIVAVAGANLGSPLEWTIAGLIAFAAAHLP